ncbi:MAG: alkaline phosphatase family protein [archaeon]
MSKALENKLEDPSRRDFFKIIGKSAVAAGAAGLALSADFKKSDSGLFKPTLNREALAEIQPGDYKGVAVFCYDGLRWDYALAMYFQGAPGISRGGIPIISECGGNTSTQPGWGSVFSGRGSVYINCLKNSDYKRMPEGVHIVDKVAELWDGEDSYVGWVMGKGWRPSRRKSNIAGYKWWKTNFSNPNLTEAQKVERRKKTPHHSPFELIVPEYDQGNYPNLNQTDHELTPGYFSSKGCYAGDIDRSNEKVFPIIQQVINEAKNHEYFFLALHSREPDQAGHDCFKKDSTIQDKFGHYWDAAWETDQYISDSMDLLPDRTIVILNSDHGFDISNRIYNPYYDPYDSESGYPNFPNDIQDEHSSSPFGFVNACIIDRSQPLGQQYIPIVREDIKGVTQMSVTREIYRLMGGDPDHAYKANGEGYTMHGRSFINL